jgi:hypothetical protein
MGGDVGRARKCGADLVETWEVLGGNGVGRFTSGE